MFAGTGRYLGLDDLVDPASLVPPNQWAYQQSIYAIKDKGTTYPNFRAANVVENKIVSSGPVSRTTTNFDVDWAVKDGWFIDLNPGAESPGERVNLDLQLVQGTLIVVSNVPEQQRLRGGRRQLDLPVQLHAPAPTCSPRRSAQAGQKFTGQITVGLVVVRLPSGVFKGIATGATGTKTPFAVNIGGGGGSGAAHLLARADPAVMA